jgi:hypothetical protein
MVLGESVVDAVDAAAVSAYVWDELLFSAYRAALQDYLGPLKGVVS